MPKGHWNRPRGRAHEPTARPPKPNLALIERAAELTGRPLTAVEIAHLCRVTVYTVETWRRRWSGPDARPTAVELLYLKLGLPSPYDWTPEEPWIGEADAPVDETSPD